MKGLEKKTELEKEISLMIGRMVLAASLFFILGFLLTCLL